MIDRPQICAYYMTGEGEANFCARPSGLRAAQRKVTAEGIMDNAYLIVMV